MQSPLETTRATAPSAASHPGDPPREELHAAAPPAARGRAALASWGAWLAFGLLLVGLCAWRLACLRVGPDPDTDAYGHYVIAQQVLETPWNLGIHWVWLPLYHVLVAGGVALGASLEQVRAANAIAAAGPALLLAWALARRARGEPLEQGVAGVAALLTASNPLLMQLGTTGQMETCFCLLMLASVALLSARRFGAAALALSALVLTRYEGWAVAAVVGAELARQSWVERRWPRAGVWACLLGPALCVLGWAALRRASGEPWFGFISQNQAFAELVLDRSPGSYDPLRALGRYTLEVPYRSFGLALPLVLLGIGRAWRRSGVWFVAPGLAIVAFLTLSSLSRSQLGLDRHLSSAVPFVATWIAHGIAGAAERLLALRWLPWARRLGPPFAALSLCVAAGAALRLRSSFAGWMELTRTALRESRAAAEFLRSTPESALIFCTEAPVEVLSGLDRSRFVRSPLNEGAAARAAAEARSRDVFVVNRLRRMGAFLHAGVATYGAIDGPPESFVAIHVRPASPRAGLGG